MNKNKLLFFIAWRYLFAKKSHAIINIISGISIFGVSIGTMALLVVLSVFNGFESLILSLYNSFHSDIEVKAVHGKTFFIEDIDKNALKNIPGVISISEIIEDMALVRYRDRQHIVFIKGVSENYSEVANIEDIIIAGKTILKAGDINYVILGTGVDYIIGANLNDFANPIMIYVPKRTARISAIMTDAFISLPAYPSGVFSVQQEFDNKYIFADIDFARQLYEYENELSSLELHLDKNANLKRTQKAIQDAVGENFAVRNRYQQQEFIYKMLKGEKLVIFIILAFILIIATFNVIGTLSMIILEKKFDVAVLKSMGMPLKYLKRLFIFEGMLVVSIGTIIGLLLGFVICFIQQHYGLLRLGPVDEAFIIQSYPVKIKFMDILTILVTVFSIGFISSWLPSYRINSDYCKIRQE